MSDAGDQLVEVEPPEIRFQSGGSKDQTSCLVRLSNQTDSYVAFKFSVKFSPIKCYSVKPKRGILGPRSQLPVVVKRNARKGVAGSDIKCKDMFMLQCQSVNANTTDADAEKMMKDGGHQVKILSVVFVSPDQPSGVASLPEEEEFILLESRGDDADNQEANQLMVDVNYQDEEEKEELFLPEGGGDSVNDQEAIDGICQKEEEEPVLPEGGGWDTNHVNQELDTQNQCGLFPGYGTSDTEAQNDDPTNREEHMQSASNGGRPDIDLTLPFTKTLRFWESIESCEVFRLLPQRPHFRPLVELDPEIREEEAIKFTVGFATLVEKIAALKPDASVGLFQHYLKQLEDLELFGFDVKAIIDRVSNLLAIQKRREHIRHRFNGVRDRITKKAGDKVKLEEGINQMDKELQEAESRQGIRISLKQIKESRAASLELQLSIVNKKVSSAEQQFKALVSAPW